MRGTAGAKCSKGSWVSTKMLVWGEADNSSVWLQLHLINDQKVSCHCQPLFFIETHTHIRRHAWARTRCEAWLGSSYCYLTSSLMDNYIVGMFITTQIAEQCSSSSPSVKTPVSDDHWAYLNRRKCVETKNKARMMV